MTLSYHLGKKKKKKSPAETWADLMENNPDR